MVVIFVRRLIQAVLVLLLVALISFAIFRFVGSPVESILGQEATVEDRNELIARMGLDDPIPVQYARFVWKAIHFDFGISYRTAEPVAELIASRLPATLELAFISALMALTVGIGFGIFTAINRGGFLAGFVMTTSLIGVSLPTFLIGVLLIWLFSVELGWLPSFGRGDTVQIGFWDTGLLTASGLKSLILPAITLGLYQMTLIMRLVRTEMLMLRQDFIKFARARGLPERMIYMRHVAQHPCAGYAAGPYWAVVARHYHRDSFQWPGVGLMFINAVYFVDIPVMSAYLLLVGALFVIINLIVDLLYLAIDPRIRDRNLKGGI